MDDNPDFIFPFAVSGADDDEYGSADDGERKFNHRMLNKYETLMGRGAWYKVYNLLDKIAFTTELLVWTVVSCPPTVPLDLWQQIVDRTDPNDYNISNEELLDYDRFSFYETPLFRMTLRWFREDNFLVLLKWRPQDVATTVKFRADTDTVSSTVLHELCKQYSQDNNAMKLRVIKACLQACPKAAFVHCHLETDEPAVTPLNVLRFDMQHALEWRDMVLEVLPDFLSYRGYLRGTILHKLIICDRDFDDSPDLRRLFADSLVEIARHAATLSLDFLMTNDLGYGTLLHTCAINDSDNRFPWTSEPEVARLAMGLLGICPEFATIPDKMGWLPLHLFCVKKFRFAFVAVIERLLKLHPDALRQGAVDRNGIKNPLEIWSHEQWYDLAEYRTDHESEEKIRRSHAYWDVAAMLAEHYGRLEMKCAIESVALEDSVVAAAARLHGIVQCQNLSRDFALRAFDRLVFSWTIADDAANFPLHKLVARRHQGSADATLISEMLSLFAYSCTDEYKIATVIADHAGNLPLHSALQNVHLWPRQPWQHDEIISIVTTALTRGSSNVLQRAAPRDGLPPFAIGASQYQLEVCFVMLRSEPNVLALVRQHD